MTLGVYLPWFIRDVVRYFAEGTSFRFHALEFRGSASALFSYAVLLCVAPAFVVYSLVPVVMMRASAGTEGMYVLCWFLYILLLAFVCVYRAVAVKWFVDFTYGGKRLLSTVCGWRAGCFVFGQALLVLVTLGLYYPMALLRVWRYYVGRLVLGREEVEDRFGFTMQPGRNYLFVLRTTVANGRDVRTLFPVGIRPCGLASRGTFLCRGAGGARQGAYAGMYLVTLLLAVRLTVIMDLYRQKGSWHIICLNIKCRFLRCDGLEKAEKRIINSDYPRFHTEDNP